MLWGVYLLSDFNGLIPWITKSAGIWNETALETNLYLPVSKYVGEICYFPPHVDVVCYMYM